MLDSKETIAQGDLFDALTPNDLDEVPAAVMAPPAAQRWTENPLLAFEEWKRSQRVFHKEYADHSVEQFRSMFSRFLIWLAGRGRTLQAARPADIDGFLASLRNRQDAPAAASTRRRYLFLLHHTFETLQHLEVRPDNPCAGLLELTRNQAYRRAAPTILDARSMRRYIEWTLEQPEDGWVAARDKALRLVFLASGITLSEARALHLPDVMSDDEASPPVMGLHVRTHGFVHERVAPVSDFAHAALKQWVKIRSRLCVPGEVVFIARAKHATHVAEPQPHAISPMEVYTIVEEAMIASGNDNSRRGPQTLRNTFIADMLMKGHPIERIMQWSGLNTTESIQAIARLLPHRPTERTDAAATASSD